MEVKRATMLSESIFRSLLKSASNFTAFRSTTSRSLIRRKILVYIYIRYALLSFFQGWLNHRLMLKNWAFLFRHEKCVLSSDTFGRNLVISLWDLALDQSTRADQSHYVCFQLSCLFQSELLHWHCRTLQRQVHMTQFNFLKLWCPIINLSLP